MKSIRLLLTCILLACFVFVLVACGNSPAENSASEATALFSELRWKVRSLPGNIMDAKYLQSKAQIMTYDSTVTAVDTLLSQQVDKYGSSALSKADWSYPREYFNDHTLLIIQYSGSDMEVIDVTTDGRTLMVNCEKPTVKTGETSIGSIQDRCYFLEVYGFIPASADDVILQISYPPL